MSTDQRPYDLAEVSAFSEDQARDYLEAIRWPNGPVCSRCGGVRITRLAGKSTPAGTLKCRGCHAKFTVRVGSIFEDSPIPLRKWVIAFHLLCSSKKGFSAKQLQRNLGLGSYESAWFMAHRIRHAMANGSFAAPLDGIVEVDETYVGGKPRKGDGKVHKRGRGTSKAPVVALVSREGEVRTRVVADVTSKTLRSAITDHVAPTATLVTDELASYLSAARGFAGGHHAVNHGAGEYARGGFHTNTAEAFFALLKRGVYGTFHHVSKQHLARYCDEFAFRWNSRKATDGARAWRALRMAEGRRLTYA